MQIFQKGLILYLIFSAIKKLLFASSNNLLLKNSFSTPQEYCSVLLLSSVIYRTFVGGVNPFSHQRLRNVLSEKCYIAFFTSKEPNFFLIVTYSKARGNLEI